MWLDSTKNETSTDPNSSDHRNCTNPELHLEFPTIKIQVFHTWWRTTYLPLQITNDYISGRGRGISRLTPLPPEVITCYKNHIKIIKPTYYQILSGMNHQVANLGIQRQDHCQKWSCPWSQPLIFHPQLGWSQWTFLLAHHGSPCLFLGRSKCLKAISSCIFTVNNPLGSTFSESVFLQFPKIS